MILRKPYAVFIKYFKLLHLIMSIFAALLLYRSVVLYGFFRTYSIDYRSALGDFSADKYLNTFSFIFIILVLILNVVLLLVMIYKKKPKSLYVYNLGLFLLTSILYILCLNALGDVNSIILDIKYSKALRDFSLIAIILQSVSLVLIVIRATGFDIKRFDFGTDLQNLDISEKDSEEIEVALEFDKDGTIRTAKNKIRYLKYFYFEHKFIINTVCISLIFLIIGFTVYRVNTYTERHSETQTFNVGSYTMNIVDSYVLDTSSSGVKLVETDGDTAGAIVAVRFQIKSYASKDTFNTGLSTLIINGLSYSQNITLAKNIADIAEAYTGQRLSDEFSTYVIAFEISKSQVNKSMTLKINDSNSFIGGEIGAKNILIKLKPKDLRKESEQSYNKKIGETISFDDSILGASNMIINSFDINNKFKLGYKYCYGTDKCMDSYEYVTPTATGNYFKTLMKISGNISIDKNVNSSVYDFRTFLNNYGTITYKINENMISKKINSEIVKPNTAKTDDYFIEVPYDIKDASEIYLSIKIRNENYKYVLK